MTPTTITEQLLSTNLFIATRESIGDSPTRDDTDAYLSIRTVRWIDGISPKICQNFIMLERKEIRVDFDFHSIPHARAQRALDLR